MTRWEYEALTLTYNGTDDWLLPDSFGGKSSRIVLDEMGIEGWELVSVVPHPKPQGMDAEMDYIFKRLID